MTPTSGPPRDWRWVRDSRSLHVLLVVVVAGGFESLFLNQGLNPMDEGWPLHAVMELGAGGTLYGDVFFVFPPGHLLPAWVGRLLDPPGLVGARAMYGLFTVGLCVALYQVGRVLMPPGFAVLGALIVGVGAPHSHNQHFLFGFRYLVWSALALLCFHARLRTGNVRWMVGAGALTGVALLFRLTPAAAVGAAIALATIARDLDWRTWVRDGAWFALGLAIVTLPALAWFGSTVGLTRLWTEVVVRPVTMTALQSTPVPPLDIDGRGRWGITKAFVAVQFRVYAVLYLGLAVVLARRWWFAFREREPFQDAFLLAVVSWGGIFFTRSLGRSDWGHLDSTLPPTALLVAYVVSRLAGTRWFRVDAGPRMMPSRATLLGCGVLALWIYLNGSDRYVGTGGIKGTAMVDAAARATALRRKDTAQTLDQFVAAMTECTRPGETMLVMTFAPMLYVLADRHSPGFHDVIMPGTFLGPDEERAFVEHLKANPPAAIVWPTMDFDGLAERGVSVTAPVLARWAKDNYRRFHRGVRRQLLVAHGPYLLLGVPGRWPFGAPMGVCSTRPGLRGLVDHTVL